MENSTIYYKEIEVIWADMDPNQHMRHTSYSQYAAHTRIAFFNERGYALTKLATMGLGAILLREQSTYRREIGLHEQIKITMELMQSTEDFSYYTISHTVYKENGKVAAKVIIDGTWIDMEKRSIAAPFPEVIDTVIKKMPFHKDFKWVEPSSYRFKL